MRFHVRSVSVWGVLSALALVNSLASATAATATIAGDRSTPMSRQAVGDWPQFHYGPDKVGVNPNETSIGVDNVDELALKWQFETGGIVKSSPAVVDGVVYIGSHDGYVYALDADDGTLIWKRNTYATVRSAPAVVNGRVYVGSWSRQLYALDAATGAVLWTHAMPGPVTAPPLVSGGVVYEGSRGSHGIGEFHAVDAVTGALKWSVKTWSVWEGAAIANGTVYVGSDRNLLWALDAQTGAIKWTAPTEDFIRCTPSVFDGVVYVGSDDQRLYAFNANTGAVIWKTPPFANGGMVRSSPAVAYGMVYIDTAEETPMGGKVFAFDKDTGAQIWVHGLSDYSTSSPAVANGLVYVGDGGGQMDAFDAWSGEMVWTTGFTVTDYRRIYGAPALAQGTLYFASVNAYVYAYSDIPGPPSGNFVTITDLGFDPNELLWHPFGKTVQWTNNGLLPHTVTSMSEILPFDSGILLPGATFSQYFHAAGQFQYQDTLNPLAEGWVKVWPTAEPESGTLGTQFTITWAVGPAPTGSVYDVRLQRPGDLNSKAWISATTDASATFTADAGKGTYKFQARMRPDDSMIGTYSPFLSVEVS